MKKLISIGLGIGITVGSVFAQDHRSQSFLTAPVLVTNILAITNLSIPLNGTPTNAVGTMYTNSFNNTNILVVATNGNFKNLLKVATLFTSRAGDPVGAAWLTNNQAAATALMPVTASISGKVNGTAGSFTPITFTFAPVPGSDAQGNPDVSTMLTGANDEWSFSITLQGAGQVNFATNVPTWLWPGYRGLVCKRIVNGTNGASSAIGVWDLKLNGFVP